MEQATKEQAERDKRWKDRFNKFNEAQAKQSEWFENKYVKPKINDKLNAFDREQHLQNDKDKN